MGSSAGEFIHRSGIPGLWSCLDNGLKTAHNIGICFMVDLRYVRLAMLTAAYIIGCLEVLDYMALLR